MKKNQTSRSYSAPALSRGLRILEVLSGQEEPCSQMRIARALGHTPSEIFRLLCVLEEEGYLLRNAAGDYSVSLKLFQAGNRIDAVKKMIQAATGPMRRFCEAHGEECHLSRLEDGRLIVLAQQTSDRPFSLHVRVGSAHDPRRTVSGRLLLAQLDPAARDGHLRRARDIFPGPHPPRQTLERHFELIRQSGVSVSENESIAGVSDTSVLVGSGSDPASMAALASSILNSQAAGSQKEKLAGWLKETAAAIQSGFIVSETH